MSEDYAREPVPAAAATRPARSIAMVISNSIMGVPIIILGATIGRDYGLGRGLIVVMLGCAITAFIAAMSAFAGVRSRCSAALLAEKTFGVSGSRLLNVVMAVALIGWFAVEMGFIGDMVSASVKDALGLSIGRVWGTVVAAGIVGAVTISGITLIAKAPLLFLPFLGCLLCAVFALTATATAAPAEAALPAVSFGTGVSAVVGNYIVGCLIMPDYSRFVKTTRAAVGAIVISLGPVYALVLGTYAAAALVTHQDVPAAILTGLGLPAVVALILPIGLLQNGIMCLYSAALTVSSLLRAISWRTATIALASVGLVLALSGANEVFIQFLVMLGIVFPPAAALLISTGLTADTSAGSRSRDWNWVSLVIWAAGIVAGAATNWLGVGLTGFPALDGFIVSAAGVALTRMRRSVRQAEVV